MNSPRGKATAADELAGLRGVIFGEHDRLRDRLATIEVCLARAAEGHGSAFVEARGEFGSLLTELIRHLEHEEALLEPVLRRITPGGIAQLERIQEEHAAERIEVGELAALGTDTDSVDWIRRMRQFAARLRADMLKEEHDFLTAR